MRTWKQVAGVTILGMACSLGFSLVLNYLLLLDSSLTPAGRMLISANVVPLAIALPLSLLLALKQRELRRVRHELTRSATYDSTTSFFKGRAFSSLVDRRIYSQSTEWPRRGAFLVINADNLSLVNMRYGLNWGEEALRLIASVIRSSVRSTDIVGRLGGGEFGIFLPGATEENARHVGERIRAGVAAKYFWPAGEQGIFTVTVGGVFFEDELGFDGMFRAAEQQLATAQHTGAVELAHETSETLERSGRTAH